MPLNAKGRKILDSMEETYGGKAKAKEVFYASINKGRIKGVEGRRHRRKKALRQAFFGGD